MTTLPLSQRGAPSPGPEERAGEETDWSGKRDSNSRPQPWQGCALPAELFPHRPAILGPRSAGFKRENRPGPLHAAEPDRMGETRFGRSRAALVLGTAPDMDTGGLGTALPGNARVPPPNGTARPTPIDAGGTAASAGRAVPGKGVGVDARPRVGRHGKALPSNAMRARSEGLAPAAGRRRPATPRRPAPAPVRAPRDPPRPARRLRPPPAAGSGRRRGTGPSTTT